MFLHKTINVFLALLLTCITVCAQEREITAAQQAQATPTPIEAKPSDQSNDRLPFMAETPREKEESAPGTGGLMLRTLGALLLIVGLIIAAAWGMKRFGGARFGQTSDDAPHLSVLNSVTLGDKRSLAVIRFGERTLLIGSTSQSISLIAEATMVTEIQSVAEMLGAGETTSFEDELYSAETGGQLAQW